jgi:hypothetical protein
MHSLGFRNFELRPGLSTPHQLPTGLLVLLADIPYVFGVRVCPFYIHRVYSAGMFVQFYYYCFEGLVHQ